MKVLFVALEHTEPGSGGKVITQRNKVFLEKYFGAENVIYFIASSMIKLNQHDAELTAQQNKVDAVFIDASSIGFFSDSFYRKYPVMTFFHNVESAFCNQSDDHSIVMRLRSALVKRIEKKNCLQSSAVLSINERDSTELRKIYGRGADCILASGMEDTWQNSVYKDGDYILFVGTDFYGNTDGLFRFIENCMKEVSCCLKVAGTGMEKYQDKYDESYNTEFLGYADSLAPLYANAKAVVLPIISGSGMKTKTCEALMHGKVIFGTDEAFEGYDTRDSDCIICNSWESFVRNINAFLETAHSFYSERNRRLFLEKYENNAAYELFKIFMDSHITERRSS